MDRSIWRASRVTWLAVGLIFLLTLVWACAVNPVTGRQQLALMSVEQELALGAANYPKTTQINQGLPPDDPELQAYVDQVGRRLAGLSHRPNVPWDFNVVNTSQVNAFALPGGKISVTRGLITKMRSEDELASVLGHEVGHVTARHGVEQYSSGVLISLGVAGLGAALGDSEYAGVGTAVAGAAGSLLMLSYSRDMERQADDLGYEYMVKGGYNPRGQVDAFKVFQSLQKSEPGFIEQMLASHPLTDERIATARQRVARSDPRLTSQPLRVTRFQSALAKQRRRAPAYEAMDKGDALLNQKKFRLAQAQYQEAIEVFPGEGLFHSRLALAKYAQKDKKGAARAAAQGARLSPQVFFTNYIAGRTFWAVDQVREARAYFARAERLLPDHEANSLFLAASFERLGEFATARKLYYDLARSAPNSQAGRMAQSRLNAIRYK